MATSHRLTTFREIRAGHVVLLADQFGGPEKRRLVRKVEELAPDPVGSWVRVWLDDDELPWQLPGNAPVTIAVRTINRPTLTRPGAGEPMLPIPEVLVVAQHDDGGGTYALAQDLDGGYLVVALDPAGEAFEDLLVWPAGGPAKPAMLVRRLPAGTLFEQARDVLMDTVTEMLDGLQ